MVVSDAEPKLEITLWKTRFPGLLAWSSLLTSNHRGVHCCSQPRPVGPQLFQAKPCVHLNKLAATSNHVKVRLDTRTLSIPQPTYPLKAPRGRDKFTVHSKAVVCQDVDLKGDITIGAGKSSSKLH